ncbi:O-methyltransferase [Marinobacter sp. M3C]|uniref:O-methyltransferase n=1 Tax=unclassified Marinobacter TaxID=83889 RepID=UPI00200E3FA8|nr:MULTISPECIES: O-methyltransferase [unclassified Marinobacter]UQG57365.1 O-methyltransferase [Marinobacter sp. M4C]UQG61464.1 O-methyltransferase [Marinobacter sp. M3C]UQG66169.1 O-methyltransferase [Marinobacter sp. M2C]UQG70449.1 O-methyltransferase [Marinobacter sp. M1C]
MSKVRIALLDEIERRGVDNDYSAVHRADKYLNITRDTGEFLFLFVQATGALRVLEFGTSNGFSTSWLALALPDDGRIVTVDNRLVRHDEAKENFCSLGISDKIDMVHQDFADYLKCSEDYFDLIFLDGDRSLYLSVVDDLLRRLPPGGVIICDNAVSHEAELRSFMHYFDNLEGFSTVLLPLGKGEYVVHRSA